MKPWTNQSSSELAIKTQGMELESSSRVEMLENETRVGTETGMLICDGCPLSFASLDEHWRRSKLSFQRLWRPLAAL